jgi:hypothetical protein
LVGSSLFLADESGKACGMKPILILCLQWYSSWVSNPQKIKHFVWSRDHLLFILTHFVQSSL